MLAYYGYFGRARAARIRGIQDQLEHLALVRDKIVAEKTRLESLEQQRDAARGRPQDRRRTSARRPSSAIDRQIKSQGGELKRLKSQAGALENLIAELRKAIERSPQAQPARNGPHGRWRGQAGSVRTAARQAAVAGAGRDGAREVRPAPGGRLDALAGHADRHGRAAHGCVRPTRGASSTATGCRAWG